MPRFVTDGSRVHDPEILGSDAEVLHFPQGGVFGVIGGGSRFSGVRDGFIVELDRTLERMQKDLQSVAEQIDDRFRLPPNDRCPPRAA